ncbi:sugar phosphate isomerase/epimerase [Candidatus Woesearchaeota archaeon]|nr:sugar phosphate isomerase/epimerase [Candidatus Woesearchaeota archaeon]
MKIGVSIRPVFPLLRDFQEFAESLFAEFEGLKDVELHTDDLDGLLIYLLNISRKFNLKYSIHCPHMYSQQKVNFCSKNKKDIEKAEFWLKKSINFAKQIKAKNIVIHPDIPKNCNKEEALNIIEDHIKNNLKYLKNQNILIENMPGKDYSLSTPEEFLNFLKRFKSKVGICWDVGHEIIRLKKQEFLFPKKLKSKIKEIHLSGILNYKDHRSLTHSNLKLRELMKILKDLNYNGAIIFEIVTKNPIEIIKSKYKLEKFY